MTLILMIFRGMMDYKEDIKRWRLILGKDTQDIFPLWTLEAISSFSEEDWLMDRALDAIYNPSGKFMGDGAFRCRERSF